MKVLITGGAGFIGSTIASACLDTGHDVVILDDLSTGMRVFAGGRPLYVGDIADGRLIDLIFAEHPDIATVLHCAAFVVVPESVAQPLRYYENNVGKTVRLLQHLIRNGCRRLVFSSSASIYLASGANVDEDSPIEPTTPYAATKAMVERVLRDVSDVGAISSLSLRYFNPIGADPLLRTGLQIPFPTHALGKIIQAYEAGEPFFVTGVDWPTRDGSGIRDFIHVWDLARAHVSAIERFDKILANQPGNIAINVGTGTGTTVRELVAAFEEAVGTKLDVRDAPSRPGDVIGCYTTVDRAAELLDWTAELTVCQAIRDGVAWTARRGSALGF